MSRQLGVVARRTSQGIKGFGKVWRTRPESKVTGSGERDGSEGGRDRRQKTGQEATVNVQQRGCASVHGWRGDEAVDVASFCVGGQGHKRRREGAEFAGQEGALICEFTVVRPRDY